VFIIWVQICSVNPKRNTPRWGCFFLLFGRSTSPLSGQTAALLAVTCNTFECRRWRIQRAGVGVAVEKPRKQRDAARRIFGHRQSVSLVRCPQHNRTAVMHGRATKETLFVGSRAKNREIKWGHARKIGKSSGVTREKSGNQVKAKRPERPRRGDPARAGKMYGKTKAADF